MGDIYVVVLAPGGTMAKAAFEPFTAGRILAHRFATKLIGVVVGSRADDIVEQVRRHCDKVLHVSGHGKDRFDSGIFAGVLAEAFVGRNTRTVLVLANDAGRELVPRLAARLNGTPLNDVVDIDAESKELIFTRAVFGGKALARVRAHAYPVVVSVPAGTFALPDGQELASVETLISNSNDPSFEVVARQQSGMGDTPLESALVIVSGGRGVGSPEPFTKELKQLADLLGGTVGASLAAVEAGWATSAQQVGQTGTIVSPSVYIAVGISGASQHLAGISGAKHVVAINKDKDAPIFTVADVGVVGDYRDVLPQVINAVQEWRCSVE